MYRPDPARRRRLIGMTFTSPFERVEPPDVNPELAALNSWLDYQRATLLNKLEGLTEEQAGQHTVPSGTTLHGIVRHLTTIEQWWFVECIAGHAEPYAYYDGEKIDWDWDLNRSEGLQADIDRYVATCERNRGSRPASTRAPASPASGVG